MKEKKGLIILIAISIILILLGIIISFKNKDQNKENVVKKEVKTDTLATMTSIEPQTVVDNKIAKVEFLSLEINDLDYEYSLKYRVKNKTSQKIAVYIFGRTINDICIYQTLSINTEIEANKEFEDEVSIFTSELKKERIENIGNMSFKITTELYPNNDVSESNIVQLKTSIYDKVKQNYEFGDIVFSDDKIDVQYVELGKSETGTDIVRLFFYNKSNDEVNLWLKDRFSKDKLNINIDGKDYYSTFNVTIPSKKYALSYVAIPSYNGNFEDVEKIRMGFSYFEKEKYTITSSTNDFEFYTKKNKSED